MTVFDEGHFASTTYVVNNTANRVRFDKAVILQRVGWRRVASGSDYNVAWQGVVARASLGGWRAGGEVARSAMSAHTYIPISAATYWSPAMNFLLEAGVDYDIGVEYFDSGGSPVGRSVDLDTSNTANHTHTTDGITITMVGAAHLPVEGTQGQWVSYDVALPSGGPRMMV